MTRKGKT